MSFLKRESEEETLKKAVQATYYKYSSQNSNVGFKQISAALLFSLIYGDYDFFTNDNAPTDENEKQGSRDKLSMVSRDKLISITFNRAKKYWNISADEIEPGKSFSFDFNKFKSAIEYVKTNPEGKDYAKNIEYIQDIILCFFTTIGLQSSNPEYAKLPPYSPRYFKMKPVLENYINNGGFNRDKTFIASKKATEAAEAARTQYGIGRIN